MSSGVLEVTQAGEKLRLSLGYGAESFPLLRSLLDRLDLEPGEVHFRPLLDMDWAHSQHNPVRNLDKSLLRSHLSDARKHDGDTVMRKIPDRSEERRVGKECRSQWSQHHYMQESEQ